MAKNVHKGTELNNVSETWDENERKRGGDNDASSESLAASDTPAANDLDKLIKEEAAEYDNDNKENRLLGGERASVNDDDLDNTEADQ